MGHMGLTWDVLTVLGTPGRKAVWFEPSVTQTGPSWNVHGVLGTWDEKDSGIWSISWIEGPSQDVLLVLVTQGWEEQWDCSHLVEHMGLLWDVPSAHVT